METEKGIDHGLPQPGDSTETPLVDALIAEAAHTMSLQPWPGLDDYEPTEVDLKRVKELFREVKGDRTTL